VVRAFRKRCLEADVFPEPDLRRRIEIVARLRSAGIRTAIPPVAAGPLYPDGQSDHRPGSVSRRRRSHGGSQHASERSSRAASLAFGGETKSAVTSFSQLAPPCGFLGKSIPRSFKAGSIRRSRHGWPCHRSQSEYLHHARGVERGNRRPGGPCQLSTACDRGWNGG